MRTAMKIDHTKRIQGQPSSKKSKIKFIEDEYEPSVKEGTSAIYSTHQQPSECQALGEYQPLRKQYQHLIQCQQ
jgi:hypothetical protein